MAASGTGIQVSLSGTQAVLGKLTKKVAEIEATNAKTVKTAAFDLVGQTMGQLTLNKSVITGTLRRSISAREKSKLEWSVGTNVEYSAPVEARKPYLQPSLDVIARRYPALATSNMRGVI
ncbi:MAG: hypothetical protein ACNYVW_03505 [Methanosarcinales archaeon]